MNGLIALVGSGEYLPVMEQVDRYLLGSLNTNGHNAACGLSADSRRQGR